MNQTDLPQNLTLLEEQWLEATKNLGQIYRLAPFIASHLGDFRKKVLFGCASLRQVWHQFEDQRLKDVVAFVEDVVYSTEDLVRYNDLMLQINTAHTEIYDKYYDTNCHTATHVAKTVLDLFRLIEPERASNINTRIACIVYCVVVATNAGISKLSWSIQGRLLLEFSGYGLKWEEAWNTKTVVDLAKGIYADNQAVNDREWYEKGPPTRLLILADALEDAGAAANVLERLRSTNKFYRGNWIVDCIVSRFKRNKNGR